MYSINIMSVLILAIIGYTFNAKFNPSKTIMSQFAYNLLSQSAALVIYYTSAFIFT